MAFICSPYFYETGEIVEITKDLRVPRGTFTVGHRFRVNGSRVTTNGTQIATSMVCDKTGICVQDEAGIENIRLIPRRSINGGLDDCRCYH